MARERPMCLERITRILDEVSGALDFAHAQRVVHRDIKEENVMLFHGQAVVLDFRIAKTVSDSMAPSPGTTTAPQLTLQGTSLGTPTYRAPEQTAGDPSLDHRADIYRVDCVAYEMLTGHPPFRGKMPQAVMIAHAKETPEPVGKQRPETRRPRSPGSSWPAWRRRRTVVRSASRRSFMRFAWYMPAAARRGCLSVRRRGCHRCRRSSHPPLPSGWPSPADCNSSLASVIIQSC